MKARRRFYGWLIAALLATAGLMLAAYLLRGILVFPLLERTAIAVFRTELDLHLTLAGIRGSLLGDLELDGVRVTTPESAHTPVDIAISRVRLDYSLVSLLGGLEPFLGGLSIDVMEPVVSIDLSRPASASGSEAPPAPFPGLPAFLPRLALEDGRLDLKGQGYESRFEGISIVSLADAAGEARPFALKVNNWRWHLPPLRDGQARAEARVAVDPDGMLTIHRLALDDKIVVESGGLDLASLPQAVVFSSRSPTSGGYLEATGRVADEHLHLTVEAEALDLALLDTLLAGPVIGLTGQVDLQARLVLPFARPAGLRGDLSLEAGAGRWKHFSWEEGTVLAGAGDGTLTVQQAEVRGSDNLARIRGLSLPAGPLFEGAIEALLAGLNADFDVSCSDLPALLAPFDADAVPVADDVGPHMLALAGQIRQGVLAVDQGHLTAAGGTVRLQRLKVALADIRTSGAAAELVLAATLDWPDLTSLARLLSLPPLAGRLRGEVNLVGTWRSPEGTLTLTGADLELGGVPVGALDLVGRSDGNWLGVTTATVRNGGDSLDMAGRIGLAAGRLEAIRMDARIGDIGLYLEPLLPAHRPINGTLAVQAGIAGTLTAPRATADVQLGGFALGKLVLHKALARLSAAENGLGFESLDVGSPYGDLVLEGRMDYPRQGAPLAIDLAALSLARNGETLRLRAPTRIQRLKDGRWQIAQTVLEGAPGRVTVAGEAGGADPADIRIDLTGIRGAAWLAGLDGPVRSFEGLDARIRLGGTVASPEIAIDGSLDRLDLRDAPRPLEGAFDITADRDGLNLRQWTWTDGAASRMTAAGEIPLRYDGQWRRLPGPLRLEAALTLADGEVLTDLLPGLPVDRAAGEARLRLAGTMAAPSGRVWITIRDVYLAAGLQGSLRGPFEGRAEAAIGRDGVVLEALTVDSALMSLQGRGRWRHDDLPAAWPDPAGRNPAGRLTASAEIRVPDLGWLAAFAPGIQDVSGEVEASLQIDGPLSEPTIAADVVLIDGGLRLPGDAPPLKALQVDLRVDADRLGIRSGRGEIGGSPFELSGELNRAADRGWTADLRLNGPHLLLFRSADLQVRADTDLHLEGPREHMTLSGDIALTGGRFSRDVDFFRIFRQASPSPGVPREILFSLPDPPLKDMRFDVAVTSRQPFKVRNNVVNGSLRPDLHLGGTGELPLLTGEIYVDPSRLRLPAGSMQISSGVVHFPATGANRPEMDLLGEGHMFDYDITALIEGPVDEPRVTLSSSPPLPGDQLLLMLLTGQPPAADRTSGGTNMNLAVYIGQDLLTQWLGGGTDESWTSVLDRFEVIQGRRVTRAGNETLEAQFLLGEDLLMDGDTIYITGEKDPYDFYNAGIKFVFEFK